MRGNVRNTRAHPSLRPQWAVGEFHGSISGYGPRRLCRPRERTTKRCDVALTAEGPSCGAVTEVEDWTAVRRGWGETGADSRITVEFKLSSSTAPREPSRGVRLPGVE